MDEHVYSCSQNFYMETNPLELDLPGFRFHPTEEELLEFYLKKMVLGNNTCFEVIGFLNIYLYDPWILPGNISLLKAKPTFGWLIFFSSSRII